MTPMTLRGMYFYMADAATFTDCATGKRFMVANNAELERGYLAARGHSEKPMLLSVEGHFTLEANPDTVAPTKVLAPDTAGKFSDLYNLTFYGSDVQNFQIDAFSHYLQKIGCYFPVDL